MGQATQTIEGRRQRTLPARRALDGRFATPEERSSFYRELGRKSAESRIVLTAAEAAAVVDAYALLGKIAERARLKLDHPPNQEGAA